MITLPLAPTTEPRRAAAPAPSLLDQLLAGQRQLTAVERFARDHDGGAIPAMAKHYAGLLPATAPGPGQQYAFGVDLDACSGCKACVTACHSLNGLDENESFRDVGQLVGGTEERPVTQHVTTACHHCLEPACSHGCPVDAYEKDPVTGIVRHLDDQCIGCQYCTLACPYGVPKYHARKGIVRKCDMCAGRLAVGEAPACVQACPHGAISVRLVQTRDVVADSESRSFVPGAHDPQYTLPTTTYTSRRALPRNAVPADYYRIEPEHAHWPLVLMLVLTQLAVGAFVAEFLTVGAGAGTFRSVHAVVAVAVGLLALNASLLHLGRPWLAFRAVIGLRHSWLSREIVAFSAFAPLSVAYAGALLGGESGPGLRLALGAAVVATGAAGVFCSVMIYATTQRAFWAFPLTATKFFATALVLGTATGLLTSLVTAAWSSEFTLAELMRSHGRVMCQLLVTAGAAKLLFELALFRHRLDRSHSPLKRTAKLMEGPLAGATLARFACGFLGAVWMPLLLLAIDPAGLGDRPVVLTAGVLVSFAACLAGEILERYLFFTAVVAPKMPGGPGT